MTLQLKRAYDQYDVADGYRILVDRLWPRGVSKSESHIDLWMKDVAPSTDLRKWFGHDPARFDDFRDRYRQEVQGTVAFDRLRKLVDMHPTVTLVFAAKDEAHNEAVVLYQLLAAD